MSRECKIRIKIGNGSIQDAKTTWGFHLMESDDTVIAPIKDYEYEEYPERSNVDIYPYTTKKPFDYTCTLLAIGMEDVVNSTVKSFYDSLFEITPGVDLIKSLPITIYNDWKGVQVTGYVKTLPGKDYHPELSEHEKGAFLFDLTIFVADPKTLIPL